MSKGIMLIEAFRAERQKQRRELREEIRAEEPAEPEVAQTLEPELTHAADDETGTTEPAPAWVEHETGPASLGAGPETEPVSTLAGLETEPVSTRAELETEPVLTRPEFEAASTSAELETEPASAGAGLEAAQAVEPAPAQVKGAEAAQAADRTRARGRGTKAQAAPVLIPPENEAFETARPSEGLDEAQGPQALPTPEATPEEVRHTATAPACTCGERFAPHLGEAHAPVRPLTEIGVGPAMAMRLGQLGLHTVRDMASADAGMLRSLLGDVSRLLDVDAWISAARRKTGSPER